MKVLFRVDDPGGSGEVLPKKITEGDEVLVWKPWMSIRGYDHDVGDLSVEGLNEAGEDGPNEVLLCTRFCTALKNRPA